ncbi:flavin-containing monooxygenase FMO GS-OX5-like protein, partial [Tanacetum coccineum]
NYISIGQMHSHICHIPEPFRDQKIAVTGNGPSAIDLSRENAMVAKEVHKPPRFQTVKVTKSVSLEMMEYLLLED